MDEDQFKAYHDALQAKEAWQRKQQTETTNKNERRYVVEQQIKNTRVCDGTSIPAVREWLQDIALVRPYFSVQHRDEDTLKVVAASLQGPMRRCYERFMDQQPDRLNVTWEAVQAMIEASYLTADEAEHLRSELEKIAQSAYETTGSYSRRFLEAASQAYPPKDRNTVVQRLVLERYIKGLRKAGLVRRLVQEKDPQTVDDAISAIEEFTVQEERLKRMMDTKTAEGGGEERMEVSEVSPQKTSTLPAVPNPNPGMEALNSSIAGLSRQLQGLQKEMTKLKGQTLHVLPPSTLAPPPSQTAVAAIGRPQQPRARAYEHSWTPDGQPICFECRQPGHLGRDCEVRRKRLQHRAGPRANPQAGN